MKTTIKPLLFFIGLAISLACADYWYNDYKSLFYPETTLSKSKNDWTSSFYYSPDYFFTFDSYGSYGVLNVDTPFDTLNVKEWHSSLEGKVNKKIIQEGLYGKVVKMDYGFDYINRDDATIFIKALNKIGQRDAATYLTILKRIDTLKAVPEGWEQPGKTADITNILTAESELSKLQNKTSKQWLRDRIFLARLKALRFASKHEEAIALYEKEGRNQSPGLIAELTRSLYAGAYFMTGDNARSYYEFSKMLRSPNLGYQGPYNVRVFDMPFNDTVLTYCKNNVEKADVHAVAAMQPKQNLPFHIRKVNNHDPNHPYLQLLVSRMINKYEDFYQVNNDKDRYLWSPEDSTAYLMPNGMFDSVMKVAFDITKTKNVYAEPFYAQAMAHLFYTKGDIPMSRLWNSTVIAKTTAQKRQKYVQELLNFLAEPKDQQLDKSMLNKIEYLANMKYGRDVHVMQTISKGLSHYYSRDTVKSFYSGNLSAISYEADWETNKTWFENGGWEQQQYLDTISTKTLSMVVKHLESQKYDQIDSSLMKLSKLNSDKLFLAYARRLMMEGNWEEGKIYFNKMSEKYFTDRLNGMDAYNGYDQRLISYEEPIFWLKSHKQTTIKDHAKFLDILVKIKINATQNPNNPNALYDFALQQYNLSYFGSAWIYTKSYKSVAEELTPASNINNYYGCDHVAATLDHAIKYAGTDKELHAKIVYLRALVEKAQAFVAISALTPENHWALNEEEQKKLDDTVNKLVVEKYSKYSQYFVDKVADSEYKRMVIKECDDIRKLVK
jgi:hypothetical protein